ncbi:MAG: N-acetylmuramoyl-L-alanine amidase, partial [Clostridia bacterium]|nr:N-acetylmuramoyl-L-alanine amidase [Clostridia bacterium]
MAKDVTCEKNINLSIGIMLKEMLEEEGVTVVLTREDDRGLYDSNLQGSIRTLKTADMHERKEIIDSAKADLVVSIHLNSFPEAPSVKGAQVFFPAEGDEYTTLLSGKAAKIIQDGLNEDVNLGKNRSELSKEDIFI